nr:hypothetical protein [Tanacetum cinerariifolium]
MAKLFNEWEKFTSNEGESIESYYHRFLKLMNDLKRNKHFPENIASNLKFLNNLQPEWSRHVIIVHQTKDLHTADYTQLYDFLKYNQNENYLQQPMPNPKDITDPTTAMNMALALMAKAFKLNYSTPTNNNQRISSNPRNRQIAQPGNVNQNQIGNGNLVAARAEGNAARQNGNPIRCYNYRGVESSDDIEVYDNFPGETLMEINTQDEPWFADSANYLVANIISKEMTYQQKNKFFSGLKHYFWEEPYLFKVCSDVLKTEEYDLWSMRMEQYLTFTDYALWEVIVNVDSVLSVASASTEGLIPPKTAKQKLARKNELKAKSTLMLAILDEHLLKFQTCKDEKSLWEAIKNNQEGMYRTYDRFQKLISQLEIHGEVISQEDANLKLLRSLPPAWNNITLIMRNKSDLDTLSMDDLYNNLKVYESKIKSQSSSSSNSHNVAFVSSDNSSSTNETVNTAHSVSAASSNDQAFTTSYADDVIFSFLSNQSNALQLDNEDLEHIDIYDLEEMILNGKWQCLPSELRGEVILLENAGHQGIKGIEIEKLQQGMHHQEGLDKTYDRFKKLISQLEIHDTLSMDDLYNNIKVYESEIKGQSSSSSNFQNVAFVSSDNTSSTNKTVNTAHSVSTASSKDQASTASYADDVMFSFFSNQSNALQLDNEDLEQIDTDDLEEIDLKWQVVMITMRVKSFQAEEKLTNFSLMAYTSQGSSSSLGSDSEESYSEDKNVFKTKEVKKTVKPSLEKIEFVNARNTTVKNQNKAKKPQKFSQSPRVLTKSGQVPVNAAKKISYRAAASVSTARHVNIDASRPNVNSALPTTYSYIKAHSPVRRPFNQKSAAKTNNFNEKVNTAKVNNITTVGPKAVVSAAEGNRNNALKSSACWIWRLKGNPQYALQDQEIFDSGCSRHMTGNKSYLIDYQEINGGFVAFGGNTKGGKITRKSVLFTDTECVVLSPDFKLLDKSQVLLKVPRNNNMYSFNLKNVVPVGENQTNGNAGTKANIDAGQARKKTIPGQQYVLIPLLTFDSQGPKSLEDEVDGNKSTKVPRKKNGVQDPAKEGDKNDQEKDLRDQEYALRKQFEQESKRFLVKGRLLTLTDLILLVHQLILLVLLLLLLIQEEKEHKGMSLKDTRIFSGAYDDEVEGAEADFNNLELTTVRIFRYLKGQPKMGLLYPRDSLFDLEAFSDSDYVGASLDSKSTIGGCQFLGKGLISWQSKKQTVVANSTTKADDGISDEFGVNTARKKLVLLSQVDPIKVLLVIYKFSINFSKLSYSHKRTYPRPYPYFSQTSMANLEFCDTHNMVAYLQKPDGSEEFHQIVDFLNTSHIRYAHTENTTIYVSLIQQFWQTATTCTLDNEQMEITATIDGKVKVVTKASVRRHLKLEDSNGMSILPTTKIFEQLTLMGFKKTAWEQFNSNIATALICLATNRTFNFSKMIFDGMVKNVDSAPSTSPPQLSSPPRNSIRQETEVPQSSSPTHTLVANEAASIGVDVKHGRTATTVTILDARQGSGNIDKTPSMPHDSPLLRVNTLGSDEGKMQHNELMDLFTKLSDIVLALEADLKQTKKVYGAAYTKLIMKVKKLEKTVKTSQARRKAKIVVPDEEVDLEDPSKQGRKIEEIDQDPNISLIQHDADIQERYEQDMKFDFDAAKEVSTAEQVSTAGAAVTTASINISHASPTRRVSTADDITMAKILVYIRRSAAKRKDKAVRLQEEFDEEERKRCARVHEVAQNFTEEE